MPTKLEGVGSTKICPQCGNATLTLVRVTTLGLYKLEWRCRCGYSAKRIVDDE